MEEAARLVIDPTETAAPVAADITSEMTARHDRAVVVYVTVCRGVQTGRDP